MTEVDLACERALTFLEKRDRTEREIMDRLLGRGFSEAASAEAVLRLRDAGYVNDANYAARYLEALTSKGYGRLRIAADMRRKGLPDELVRNTIEDGLTAESEREMALHAARRVKEAIPCDTDARKASAKVSRRLVSLGFSYDVIGDVMGVIRSGEDGLPEGGGRDGDADWWE
jgi:regulatory protein